MCKLKKYLLAGILIVGGGLFALPDKAEALVADTMKVGTYTVVFHPVTFTSGSATVPYNTTQGTPTSVVSVGLDAANSGTTSVTYTYTISGTTTTIYLHDIVSGATSTANSSGFATVLGTRDN